MVFRHTEAPYSEIVSLFHMAMFFIASGYLFKPERVNSAKNLFKYVLKKMKNLWLPFVFFSTFFVLLNNIFVYLNIYTDNPLFLEAYSGRYPTLASYMSITDMAKKILNVLAFQGSPQLGGALWFLQCLFYLSVSYAVVEYILQRFAKEKNVRYILQGLIACCFLAIGYFCYMHGIGARGLNRFFSYYCLYYIGRLMNEYRLMDYVTRMKNAGLVLQFVLSFFVLTIMQALGVSVEIVENSYMNPIILLVTSVVGWIMMFSIASLLNRISFIGNRAITYVSIHSVPIIGLHFLAFKLVNWIATLVCEMDSFMIAAFPVLMHGAWWIAYLVVGISFPLILEALFLKAKYGILSIKGVS